MTGDMPPGVSIAVLEDVSVPPAGFQIPNAFDSLYLQAATGALNVRWPDGNETPFPLFKKWRFKGLVPGCRILPADGTSTYVATIEHSAGVEMDDYANRVDGALTAVVQRRPAPLVYADFVVKGSGVTIATATESQQIAVHHVFIGRAAGTVTGSASLFSHDGTSVDSVLCRAYLDQGGLSKNFWPAPIVLPAGLNLYAAADSASASGAYYIVGYEIEDV